MDEGFDDRLTRDIYFEGSSMAHGAFSAGETKRLVFLIDQHRDRSPLAARLQQELLVHPSQHEGGPLRASLNADEAREVVEALRDVTGHDERSFAKFRDDLAAALG